MEDYTKEEVLKALNLLDQTTRKRVIVDQRSYLIGVLSLKFGLAEHAIAKETGLKRTKVNYNKRLPIQFKDDVEYQKNVYVYSQMFPYDFSKIYTIKSQRKHTVVLTIDDKLGKKLLKIRDILGHEDIRTTMLHLIEKSIKLWEE
jgi:hypothetical protein